MHWARHEQGSKRTGTIIAAHGRHYLAESEGQRLQCVTRGKITVKKLS